MKSEYTVLHLFSGIGGAALGFQDAAGEYRGMVGRFRTLAGIDCDLEACADFEALTGAPAIQMDLFSREDYRAFHGCEPPESWQEATASDIREATGREYPNVVFLSPPCKGFSGLLPSKSAASEKYQALNRLVIRGLKLTLEAFCDDLPAVIMLENVPRITSRGQELLREVKRLLGAHGYLFHEGYHDCGEIGGLGQHRKRYLLIARLSEKMSAFIYRPERRRVKSIGEVIGSLPMPDDPACGPMHRLPRLQWKTWVRLALIPAGGDWRDLEKIAPEQYRLEYVPRGGGSYGVQEWNTPRATVTGSAYVKGSNAVSVADPRTDHFKHSYRITDWQSAAGTVTGGCAPSNGAACVADPRLTQRENRHPGVYRVVKFDEPAPCVTGTRFGSGAPAIADPRLNARNNRRSNSYTVRPWDGPAHTITGEDSLGSGAQSIADPRTGFKDSTHHAIYRVGKWDEPAKTVTGANRPNNGAISISDPRLGCKCRSGTMGIQAWDMPGKTVTGSGDVHQGTAAVADPRIPADNEQGIWVIISLDGAWHRPLTTLELAALQGFPMVMPDGRTLQLAGNSDARWRERIGNAVPPPAARAIGEEILTALMVSECGEWVLGATGVWVRNEGDLIRDAFLRGVD